MFDDPTIADPSLSGNVPPSRPLDVFKKGPGLQISFPVGSQFSKTFAYTPISSDGSNLRLVTSLNLPCPGTWVITATVVYTSPFVSGTQTKALKFTFSPINTSSGNISTVNGVVVDRTLTPGDSFLRGVWTTYDSTPAQIQNFCFMYKNSSLISLPQPIYLMGQIYTDPYNSEANITGTVSWTRIL